MFVVKPLLTRLHKAVPTIFEEIGYTDMSVVECFSSSNSEVKKMRQTLEDIKPSLRTFIFVKCVENLDLVLEKAKEIGLTTSDFRWVFPGVIDLKRLTSKNLPQNVIAVDLPGSDDHFQDVEEDNALFLSDVLSVLEKTLRNNHGNLLPETSPENFTKSLKRYKLSPPPRSFICVSSLRNRTLHIYLYITLQEKNRKLDRNT